MKVLVYFRFILQAGRCLEADSHGRVLAAVVVSVE